MGILLAIKSRTPLFILCAAALDCAGSAAKRTEARTPEATLAPRWLPEYPGAWDAGSSGGTDEPVSYEVVSDPVDSVRAFYSRERLAGFEVLEGDLTTAAPLHVRDAAGHRDLFIAVYEEDRVTMIRITTKPL